jgi:hypothetical protein
MQKPLALLTKQLYFPNMKYFEVVDIYFLIDIRGWVKIFSDFSMVGSAKKLPRKTFFFVATPP